MSHLVAMRTAIYSPTATSRYALIVEDDVQFPFDIDYEALAATAPEGSYWVLLWATEQFQFTMLATQGSAYCNCLTQMRTVCL
jgi:GR25 family glycosyltransferase involved in LPS biosynthesis